MNNRQVAETFERIADMLAIRGEASPRLMAYRRAAESVRELGRDLHTVAAEGKLTDIPGIGSTLAAKIEEMLSTGSLAFYDRLAAEVPPGLVDILRVPGLGPKRVKQIYDTLGVTSLEELAEAAEQGKLASMPGLGARSVDKIRAAVAALQAAADGRLPLGSAWPIAQQLVAELGVLEEVRHVAVTGSLRRMCETAGNLDLLVAADDPRAVVEAFGRLDWVEQIVASSPSTSSAMLLNAMRADVRVASPERWGTMLVYFTGNRPHNERLRELALEKGYALNEYCLTPLAGGDEVTCASEEELYGLLGLPFIPAEMRQDTGEIEAAGAGRLPDLVTLDQIRGDLQTHSTWSDGKLTILEMAQTAKARGLRYLAVTDHSYSLTITGGLTPERLAAQADEVRAANAAIGPDFRILHATEMEIRADGTLDFDDDVLRQLDFVVASLHVGLRQTAEETTRRVLGAIANPLVDMIAHPTGRLLPDRQGADLDMDAVLRAAAAQGTIMEVNANPRRLDLRDNHVRQAVELGVRLAINTDAHRADELDLMPFGVGTARRGWATAAGVANTWPVEELLAYTGRRRERAMLG